MIYVIYIERRRRRKKEWEVESMNIWILILNCGWSLSCNLIEFWTKDMFTTTILLKYPDIDYQRKKRKERDMSYLDSNFELQRYANI